MTDERASTRNDQLIGARIRRRRLEIGMSQERLAELLGVTFQQVQKYEKGVNRVACSRLYDVAHALGASIDWFFADCTKNGATLRPLPAHHPELASAESVELQRLFSTIRKPVVRKRVVALVGALAESPA